MNLVMICSEVVRIDTVYQIISQQVIRRKRLHKKVWSIQTK